MRSIRTRIMIAILTFSTLTGVIAGGIGIYRSSEMLERNSREVASLTAEKAPES